MAKSKRTNSRGRGRPGSLKLTKRNADRHALYLASVQEPEVEVAFFDRVYRKEFGRRPRTLREDFCGTAAICCEWVKGRPDRSAVGIDLDPEPLRWCRENLLSKLTLDQCRRIKLVRTDVLSRGNHKADVLAAQNFSFFIFKTREGLREYFAAARSHLNRQGLMVMDMMGGSELQLEDHTDTTRRRGFTYHWEQKRFDPLTHDAKFAIHFRFPDGSVMRNAFTYDWRLWTIPEVRELLLEAGFSRADVYWEGTTPDGRGDDVYRVRRRGDADPAWICYVVAVR